MLRLLKTAYFLENYIGNETGNVVIFDVNAVIYVLLSRAEKYVHYGEVVGTTKYITL